MASDVKLDEGHPDWVVIEGSVLQARTADFILDSPQRRSAASRAPFRRALVHDQRDGLTINYNGDYPAGVSIINARVNLSVVHQDGGEPQLPKAANIGDLLMIVNTRTLNGTPLGSWTSLWLCVPGTLASANATWQQVQLGATTPGTM